MNDKRGLYFFKLNLPEYRLLGMIVPVKISNIFKQLPFCSIIKTKGIVILLDLVFNCKETWMVFISFYSI